MDPNFPSTSVITTEEMVTLTMSKSKILKNLVSDCLNISESVPCCYTSKNKTNHMVHWETVGMKQTVYLGIHSVEMCVVECLVCIHSLLGSD